MNTLLELLAEPLLIELLLLVAATGALAGFLSGVLGVGGGVVIVPVLYYIFISLGFSIDVSLHTALGTSLATIIITQGRSALSHRARGSFNGQVLRMWAVPLTLGALSGGMIAGFVSGKTLAFIFASGISLVALVMIYRARLDSSTNAPAPPHDTKGFALASPMRYPTAFLSGLFSAITGIGGGTFNVSALTLMFRLNIRESIGTSSALGVLIGLCGTFMFILGGTFILGGIEKQNLIPYSLGYIHLPSAALVVLFSILTAPLGVAFSHKIEQRQLQIFFALMLLAAAVKMFYEGWQA